MALHAGFQIRWKNYRAFKDTDWLDIRPLTILIGPNNSGKTSVISPLLLLDQTMSSRDALVPLVTRGPLADVGLFKNIIHNHDDSKPLFLGIRYHVHKPDQKSKAAKIDAYPPGAVEVTLSRGSPRENIVLKEFELFDIYKRSLMRQSLNPGGTYRVKSNLLKSAKPREREALRRAKPINFLFSSNSVLRELHSMDEDRRERTRFRMPSVGFIVYYSALGAAFGELSDMFRNLSYVGPLREHPRRSYPIASEMPMSVGSRGEHMANLIRARLPELRQRLNGWIRRFQFGSRLVVDDLSDEIFSLSFKTDNLPKLTNIADAGFGASQVLPLIVQALAAPAQSLTIAEQPEIHLNPRLQYLLADLFAEMANSDHRVIVETHSEHLLLRLRRLVASGAITHEKVALYFVEKKDGISTIRRIPIEQNGSIPSETWPQGFFEDTLGESLALAAAQSPTTKNSGVRPLRNANSRRA